MHRKAPLLLSGAVVPLLLAALLAGCGQKGPLYVEGHGKDTPWPMKPAGDSPDARKAPPPGNAAATPGGTAPPAAGDPPAPR